MVLIWQPRYGGYVWRGLYLVAWYRRVVSTTLNRTLCEGNLSYIVSLSNYVSKSDDLINLRLHTMQ